MFSSSHLISPGTYCWVHVPNLGSSPNVDFIFIFLFCCLPVNWIVKVHAFGILPFPVSPDEVSPHAQQANDHWGEGTEGAVRQDGSAGTFPCWHHPQNIFSQLGHCSPAQQFLDSFPPHQWKLGKCIYCGKYNILVLHFGELLQRFNPICLPTGMTIPITAAVTVEPKPSSSFASVIKEMFWSFNSFAAFKECFLLVLVLFCPSESFCN